MPLLLNESLLLPASLKHCLYGIVSFAAGRCQIRFQAALSFHRQFTRLCSTCSSVLFYRLAMLITCAFYDFMNDSRTHTVCFSECLLH